MTPMLIFEGRTAEPQDDSGCNAGSSSSVWLCLLMLGLLRKRRRVSYIEA